MKTMILATTLCAGLLTMSASSASATPFSFEVLVNTASLVPLVGTVGPFSLDFQLNGTGANTVTVDNFNFGGGGFVGAPVTSGDASGSLASAVTLSDATFFANELFQEFMPGTFLSFDVTMTNNVVEPTPDAFSIAILDGSLFNIPTDGLGDALLLANIDHVRLLPDDVHGFHGLDTYAGIDAEAVPEPASLFLFGSGLIGLARWRRRRAGTR